jgi:hypothetical protein
MVAGETLFEHLFLYRSGFNPCRQSLKSRCQHVKHSRDLHRSSRRAGVTPDKIKIRHRTEASSAIGEAG